MSGVALSWERRRPGGCSPGRHRSTLGCGPREFRLIRDLAVAGGHEPVRPERRGGGTALGEADRGAVEAGARLTDVPGLAVRRRGTRLEVTAGVGADADPAAFDSADASRPECRGTVPVAAADGGSRTLAVVGTGAVPLARSVEADLAGGALSAIGRRRAERRRRRGGRDAAGDRVGAACPRRTAAVAAVGVGATDVAVVASSPGRSGRRCLTARATPGPWLACSDQAFPGTTRQAPPGERREMPAASRRDRSAKRFPSIRGPSAVPRPAADAPKSMVAARMSRPGTVPPLHRLSTKGPSLCGISQRHAPGNSTTPYSPTNQEAPSPRIGRGGWGVTSVLGSRLPPLQV